MTCEDARGAMLSAPAAELRGSGAGALAVHLGACAGCTARAEFICAAMERLQAALPTDSGAKPARIRAPARRIAVGLSIAAGLIVAVALGIRRPGPPPDVAVRRAPMHGNVVIENAQGREVTVLQGTDTTMIVFWNRGAR